MVSGRGGVGTSRASSFASSSSTACGSGRSCTRKSDSRRRPASSAPTASLARIMCSSTSACAAGSSSTHARSTPPRPSNANSISPESMRRAPRRKRRRRSSSASVEAVPSASPSSAVDAFAPREDCLRLAVGQPRVRPDDAAIEQRLARDEARAERNLDGDAVSLSKRHQAAEAVRRGARAASARRGRARTRRAPAPRRRRRAPTRRRRTARRPRCAPRRGARRLPGGC